MSCQSGMLAHLKHQLLGSCRRRSLCVLLLQSREGGLGVRLLLGKVGSFCLPTLQLPLGCICPLAAIKHPTLCPLGSICQSAYEPL